MGSKLYATVLSLSRRVKRRCRNISFVLSGWTNPVYQDRFVRPFQMVPRLVATLIRTTYVDAALIVTMSISTPSVVEGAGFDVWDLSLFAAYIRTTIFPFTPPRSSFTCAWARSSRATTESTSGWIFFLRAMRRKASMDLRSRCMNSSSMERFFR